MRLTLQEQGILDGLEGPGRALAIKLVIEAGTLLGAAELIPITSSHIDGCIYYGDAGVLFVERLVHLGARTAVPATLNVGALDLLHPDLVQSDAHHRKMARRLMDAHTEIGCLPTWTCAPYQAGHRPGLGEQVAWGESNAVAFCNSVLGARTNRYGDLLDICCAISGRAPNYGLHQTQNRRAVLDLDCSGLSDALKHESAFYPVIGALLGERAGESIGVLTGLPADIAEDDLKALGAAAASRGSVGLFHVAGVTPEAPDRDTALQGQLPEEVVTVTPEMVARARDSLSTASGQDLDCVALGSPHFSIHEFRALAPLLRGSKLRLPFYVCTSRATLDQLETSGLKEEIEAAGVTLVVDTCVVVTPILAESGKVMMTNSGKFAHYARGTVGYESLYGTLADCVASAEKGSLCRAEGVWS